VSSFALIPILDGNSSLSYDFSSQIGEKCELFQDMALQASQDRGVCVVTEMQKIVGPPLFSTIVRDFLLDVRVEIDCVTNRPIETGI
jgi:hypothetical protein